MLKRIITFAIPVLLSTVFIFTGCTMKNPANDFKVIVEGDIQKTVIAAMDSATHENSIASVASHTFSSTSDELNGTDLFTIGFSASSDYADDFQSCVNGTFNTGELCAGTFRNNTASPTVVTLYLIDQATLGTGISSHPLNRLLKFTIPANGTKTINRQAGPSAFDSVWWNSTLQNLFPAAGAANNTLYYYFLVTSPSAINMLMTNFNLYASANLSITQNLTPGDVSSYGLQAVNHIGLSGTFTVNYADSVNIKVYCKAGTGSNTTPSSSMTLIGNQTVYTANNQRIDLMNLSNTILTTSGQTFLSSRFGELFPPTGQQCLFRIVFTSQLTPTYFSPEFVLNNLAVVCNCRVQRN